MGAESAAENSPGTIELVAADPEAIRDGAVAFWFDRKLWRDWPIEKYYTVWDWRYRSLSDGPPLVCVARNKHTGRVVGHSAVYRRHFQLNGTRIAVGIPANLAVHADYQGGIAGASLASLPGRELRAGRYDVLLAFANRAAHEIFLRLGARDLGVMSGFTDLHRTGPTLRRSSPLLAPLGFILDAGLSMRRGWLRYRRGRSRRIDVCRVSGDEFRRLDRSHWVPPKDRVVAADSAEHVVRRYLECPYEERELFALLDARTGTCEGYVVTQGTGSVDLWDVQVNGATLDVPTAILSATRAFRGVRSVTTSALPGTMLANDLAAAGFLRARHDANADYPRFVDGTVRSRHQLASELADFSRWNLWMGSSQY